MRCYCYRRLCEPCDIELEDGKLDRQDFNSYLSWFLKDNPSKECPKGGHASYSRAINLHSIDDTKTGVVGATNFMTYHTVLKNSNDYTKALKEARTLAKNITAALNHGGVILIHSIIK